VLEIVTFVLVGTLGTLAVQYWVSDRAIGTEFFRAHKTISHTGELLYRGTLMGSLVFFVLALAFSLFAFRLTHRIVRPVHTLHRALDALAAGDLGVRVDLHEKDEFREVGDALNHLVDEFVATLARVHALVDDIAAQTAPGVRPRYDVPPEDQLPGLVRDLDAAMDFFRLGPRRIVREPGD
jgi:methyl-accepting chemotaxis protein